MSRRREKKKILPNKLSKDFILQFVAFFLIFFYPFNYAISNQVLLGPLNSIIFTSLGVLILSFTKQIKIEKNRVLLLVALLIAIILMLINNAYILHDYSMRSFVLQILYLVTLAIMFFKKINIKALILVVALYSLEHIIGTIIPIVLPSLYVNSVIPFMCKGTTYCFAKTQFLQGNNPGLTTHYSSNGINIAISSLLFSASYMKTKKRMPLLLAIISIGLLLIIGKRAHLIFTIISIAITYLYSRVNGTNSIKDYISKHIRLILLSILALLAISVMSTSIPQLNNTVKRINERASDSKIMNGREDLYELAIDKWKDSPIIGNGYGYYLYESSNHVSFDKYHLVNIHAHNDYLELLCDTGIIGLVFYLIILAYAAIISSKNIRQKPSIINIYSFSYLLFHILYSFTGTPLGLELTFSMFAVIIGIISQRQLLEEPTE